MSKVTHHNKSHISLLTIYCTLILFLYVLFLFNLLKAYSFNFSGLIVFGDKYADSKLLPKSFLIKNNSSGYDGQFFYRFSLNPFSTKETEHGITIDDPPYRQKRLIYPLISWFFSLGNPHLATYALFFVNLLSIILLTYFSIYLIKGFGLNPLFGLIIPLYPGFLFTFARDLTEILETVLIIGGVYFFEKKKFWSFSIILCLAVLTKETSLLVPIGLFFYTFFRALFGQELHIHRKKMYTMLIPAVVYVLTRLWMFLIWGNQGVEIEHLTFPMSSFFEFIISVLTTDHFHKTRYLIELLYISIFALIILSITLKEIYMARKIFYKNPGMAYVFVWILYFFLLFSLSSSVWIEDYSYMRVASGFFITGYLILIKFKYIKLLNLMFVLNLGVWIYIARDIILFL